MTTNPSDAARHARLLCAAEQAQSTFSAISALCMNAIESLPSSSDGKTAAETLEAAAMARQILSGTIALCSQHLERSLRDMPIEIEGPDAIYAWRCAQAEMLQQQAESTVSAIMGIANRGQMQGTGVGKGFWGESEKTRAVNTPFKGLCSSILTLCRQYKGAQRP